MENQVETLEFNVESLNNKNEILDTNIESLKYENQKKKEKLENQEETLRVHEDILIQLEHKIIQLITRPCAC